MRAVLADVSTARYLATAVARRVDPRAGWRRTGLLSLRDDLGVPAPPGQGWLVLRPELSGICGTDVALAKAALSLTLSAFGTARTMIPGHEVVAVVEQAAGTRFVPGERVVLDPVLACRHRGFEPVCSSCARGLAYACERADERGRIHASGPAIGYDTTLGGGWSQYLVAHESQLFAVGDVPSRRAVLAEPASIALHAALHWPGDGERAVVIGPGTIGCLATAALRMLHPDLDIAVVCPGEAGESAAMRSGASRTLPTGRAGVESLAASDGGRLLRPRMTRLPILERGVDVVLDCVGSPDTIDLALHVLRPGGLLVMVGSAGRQPMDWSLVWNRQITVQGTIFSGPEPALGGRHTMEQVVDWLADPAYPVDHLVTHVHTLDQWTSALDTALAGPAARAIKVALRPNPDLPLVP